MGLTYGLIAATAVFGIVAFVLLTRVRALAAESAKIRDDYEKARGEIRTLAEKERKASGKLEERVSEVQQLKKDLGAHKKKAHHTQDELKTLRSELKSAQEAAKAAATSRPAFADPTPKAKLEAPSPAPAKQDDTPELRARIEELEATIETLNGEKSGLKKKIDAADSEIKKAKGEARKAKRRVDDYRRADMVARSRSELTDDKVRHLSRQYYEAVSELAALKGEVAPPARELEDVRRDAAEVERAALASDYDAAEEIIAQGDDNAAVPEPANGEEAAPSSA